MECTQKGTRSCWQANGRGGRIWMCNFKTSAILRLLTVINHLVYFNGIKFGYHKYTRSRPAKFIEVVDKTDLVLCNFRFLLSGRIFIVEFHSSNLPIKVRLIRGSLKSHVSPLGNSWTHSNSNSKSEILHKICRLRNSVSTERR